MRVDWSAGVLLLCFGAAVAGCGRDLAGADDVARRLESPVRFAVIGDYGTGGDGERDVAALVGSWNVDFVVTTGDNNYPAGAADTIDRTVGQYWSAFVEANRFFPVLGNHDWAAPGAQPYLDYFTLPGNERYYDVSAGPVHVFALDSDPHEPDGVDADSPQAAWMCGEAVASTARWKLAFVHNPPYSSGRYGSVGYAQWAFGECGVDAVFAGHDHHYERLVRGGVVYFVNGLGGSATFVGQRIPIEGSRARFEGEFGAQLVEADGRTMLVRFFTRGGELVDWVALGAGAAEP